ncbi:MAG: hypothetical protein ACTSUE_22120 [Promethearchaeota archaeon]
MVQRGKQALMRGIALAGSPATMIALGSGRQRPPGLMPLRQGAMHRGTE